MKTVYLTTLAALIAISTPSLRADDAPQSRIKELRTRAAEAKQQGRMEEAEKFHHAAEELAKAAQNTDRKGGGDKAEENPKMREMRERVAQLQQKAREAKEAGRAEESQKLSEEAEQIVRRAREGSRKDANPERERMQHIENAIRSLRAAGLNEPADALQKQLERGRSEHGGDVEKQLQEMRRAIGEMQQAIQGMQRRMEEMSRR